MTDTTNSNSSAQPAQGGQAQPGAMPQGRQGAQDVKPPIDRPDAHDLGRSRLGPSGFEDDRQQPGQQQQGGGADEVQIGDVKIAPDKLKEIMARQAADDARKLTLPQSPEAYELKTPDTFKPPEGVKFEFNKDDPTIAQARQLAHARGMDQATFSDFLGIYAANKIAEATVINNARNAEIAKLGSAVPQRIDAVKTWAHGTLGSELGGAIEQMLVTAKHVEAFERIMQKFSGQGGTPFDQRGRQPPQEQGKIPGYETMTFEQRRAAQMSMAPQNRRTYRDPGNLR
jgi:hypothetical protein